MQAGTLDRRIRIEQRSGARDSDYGTPTEEWTTFASAWARIEQLQVARGESTVQGIDIAERPAKVTMRYLDGVTSAMRVIDLDRGNRVLKITSQPVEIGRKREMEFAVADFTTAGNAT